MPVKLVRCQGPRQGAGIYLITSCVELLPKDHIVEVGRLFNRANERERCIGRPLEIGRDTPIALFPELERYITMDFALVNIGILCKNLG